MIDGDARTLGFVLAAGAGVRFGGPKAPYVYKGERLVDRAVSILRSGGCDQVFVVLGAWVGDVPDADAVLVNHEWEEGISTSLKVALEHALKLPAERICITLVDLPGLNSRAIEKVLASQGELVQATYRNEPTHPVVIGRAHWRNLLDSLSGHTGASNYLKAHADVVEKIAIDDVAVGDDLDFQPT